jgi:hypothetical protein
MGMKRIGLPGMICAALALHGVRAAGAEPAVTGSTAFCLYEVPSDEPGKRRWINLGIVQYVEATRTELRIYFGGGSLGSGHEAKIPFASMEEAAAIMEKLRKTAAACR